MRTQTENPPTTFTDFRTTGGFLEQGVETSWERIVQAEITRRPAVAGVAHRRSTMMGLILASISATTLSLAEIYRHLDGAITGQIGTAAPLQKWLLAGIIAGLAVSVIGRFLPRHTNGRWQRAR